MSRFSGSLIRSMRDFRSYADRPGLWNLARKKIARARHVFWSIVTHSDIDPMVRIGANLQLPHPNGVIFHGDAVIGANCMIMQQVTIGMIGSGEVPVIGDGVYIGAGAKVIGKLTVGDGARIGANAVVLNDVPPHCTAVGNPARVIRRAPTVVDLKP